MEDRPKFVSANYMTLDLSKTNAVKKKQKKQKKVNEY